MAEKSDCQRSPWPPGTSLFSKKGPSLFLLFPCLFFASFCTPFLTKNVPESSKMVLSPRPRAHFHIGTFDTKRTPKGAQSSLFGSPDPPRTPFLAQSGVRDIGVLHLFSLLRSVVPLWAPKVTPRVAQGPPKAAPRSLFGHFWTTLGHFLVDFDHFRAPFRSLLLAFGDVLRVSLISVDFYAFPAKFLTFPLKFLTFSSWKVWNILAV